MWLDAWPGMHGLTATEIQRCRCLSVCAGLYNTRRSSSSCTFQGGHRPQNYEHHVTQGDNRSHAQHDAVTTGIYIYIYIYIYI